MEAEKNLKIERVLEEIGPLMNDKFEAALICLIT